MGRFRDIAVCVALAPTALAAPTCLVVETEEAVEPFLAALSIASRKAALDTSWTQELGACAATVRLAADGRVLYENTEVTQLEESPVHARPRALAQVMVDHLRPTEPPSMPMPELPLAEPDLPPPRETERTGSVTLTLVGTAHLDDDSASIGPELVVARPLGPLELAFSAAYLRDLSPSEFLFDEECELLSEEAYRECLGAGESEATCVDELEMCPEAEGIFGHEVELYARARFPVAVGPLVLRPALGAGYRGRWLQEWGWAHHPVLGADLDVVWSLESIRLLAGLTGRWMVAIPREEPAHLGRLGGRIGLELRF